VVDAYAALRGLRTSPIDAERIAILGFSYGGEMAHLTAFERLRSALHPGSGRFAAHVAFYPGGSLGAIAERGAYTGAPLLMLLGGKDDICRWQRSKITWPTPKPRAIRPDRNRNLSRRLHA